MGALIISAVLGIIAGSAFHWAALALAWNLFIAGFLWTLLIAVGVLIFRCFHERVRKGEWRRGITMAWMMMFPTSTIYMATIMLITIGISANRVRIPGVLPEKPDMLIIAPLFYGIILIIATLLGSTYVLTSPFRPAEARR
jgi:hypothetical protein